MYMRKYNQFDSVILKDGRIAAVVDFFGDYYIVDVGSSPEDWDTIEVREDEIVGTEDDFNDLLVILFLLSGFKAQHSRVFICIL